MFTLTLGQASFVAPLHYVPKNNDYNAVFFICLHFSVTITAPHLEW